MIKILIAKIIRLNLGEIPSTQILGIRVMKIGLMLKLQIKMRERRKMNLSKRSVDNRKKFSFMESKN